VEFQGLGDGPTPAQRSYSAGPALCILALADLTGFEVAEQDAISSAILSQEFSGGRKIKR
jgi:hypothetical protein